MEWRVAHAAVCGRGHAACRLPCQDAVVVHRAERRLGVCVCDGAGSAPLSLLGAQAVAEQISTWLARGGPAIPNGGEVIAQAGDAIRGVMQLFGGEAGEYACTMLGLAVGEQDALAVHLGDGVIGAVEAGQPSVVSGPERGEFANQTVFVTSSRAADHVRVTRVEIRPLLTTFVLMTDGAEAGLYDKRSGALSQVAEQMARWLDQANEEDTSSALRGAVEKHLLPRTLDDCTVALLRRTGVRTQFACPECGRWELVRRPEDGRFAVACVVCGAIAFDEPAGRYPAVAREWVMHLATERQESVRSIGRATRIPRRTLRRWLTASRTTGAQ